MDLCLRKLPNNRNIGHVADVPLSMSALAIVRSFRSLGSRNVLVAVTILLVESARLIVGSRLISSRIRIYSV